VVDRVNAAVDRFVGDDSWRTALLVLHGGVNRAILSRAITGNRVLLGHIEQSSACINIIDLIPGWFVRAVNITPYDLLHVGIRTTSLEEMAEDYRRYRSRG
jgi:broad specificity phosphatase PhoE